MDKSLNTHRNARESMLSTSVVSSVLEAAAATLPAVGYQKATTNVIAESAGVSIGSLYYHFENKDEVFQTLANQVIASYSAQLMQKLDDCQQASEFHHILISEAVDFTFKNRILLRSLFSLSEKIGKTTEIYNLRNRFAEQLNERICKLRGPTSPLDAFVLVNAINGVLDNCIYADHCILNQDNAKSLLMKLAKSFEQSAPSENLAYLTVTDDVF